MAQTDTMTLRVSRGLLSRLDQLAKATERTRAFLAQRAIEEYVESQEWQVSAIEEAVAEANRPGAHFLDHEEVVARMQKLKKTARARVGK